MNHRIALLASGAGTNAGNLIRFFNFNNSPDIRVVLVACNNALAGAFGVAREYGVPEVLITRENFSKSTEFLAVLGKQQIDWIVLAGFLWKVPEWIIEAYPDRIINIHPSLLPRHGGKGMFGRHVHEAVSSSGEMETGITIHYVNGGYDEGRIIFQAAVKLSKGDRAEDVERKVRELEMKHFPEVLDQVIRAALSPPPAR